MNSLVMVSDILETRETPEILRSRVCFVEKGFKYYSATPRYFDKCESSSRTSIIPELHAGYVPPALLGISFNRGIMFSSTEVVGSFDGILM